MISERQLLEVFEIRGQLTYEGESLNQLEHAWQCGQLAKSAGASETLQLAAWLHDVGHLFTNLAGTPTLKGVDDRHEVVGAELLHLLWGPEVSQPVRLHVQAKRYMFTCVPGYTDKLSTDSMRSLALQGGPMSDSECEVFRADTFSDDAQRLRSWDEAAKRNGWFKEGFAIALGELQELMDICTRLRATNPH
jgi:predicted HD phosphohydrolase